jgi:hypothetical protein
MYLAFDGPGLGAHDRGRARLRMRPHTSSVLMIDRLGSRTPSPGLVHRAPGLDHLIPLDST